MMGGPLSDDTDATSISSSRTQFHHRERNVFSLLLRREISPRTKSCPKWNYGEAPKKNVMASFGPRSEAVMDARRGLLSWVEADSLQHLSAKYCPLFPPPRSTIAASFSLDGKRLASTHGDHTVKIIDCQTRRCLKVLSGHRRTPWVVRFHPHEEILASGSLDHEVRLWHAITSECIESRDFYRPVASIAFHAEGEVLAVASGHKLYMWIYNGKGDDSIPTIVLKTRRSLRAVHFHPHGAPLLLTAEVNDLDSSDSSLTKATSSGSVHNPPPSVYVTNVHPNDNIDATPDSSLMDFPFMYIPFLGREHFRSEEGYVSTELPSAGAPSFLSRTDGTLGNFCPRIPGADNSEALDMQLAEQPGQITVSTNHEADRVPNISREQEILLSRNPTCWELPFLQGWLVGQSQASMPSGSSPQDSHGFLAADFPACYRSIPIAPFSVSLLSETNLSILMAESHRFSRSTQPLLIPTPSFTQTTDSDTSHDINRSLLLRIQSEVAASLAATGAAELPCTVKLKLWCHNVKSPREILDSKKCRLSIPHVVLCSEMGAHFSPCGRLLAACVACVPSNVDSDPSLLTQLPQDVLGAQSSPTRHPISAREIMYELRVYSLAEATFGLVLASRAIKSAHCLTSIQFSPTSEHILLAYGRRHSSLLKSIIISGDTSLSVYTVLEVYRVSDMKLVSMLPSVDDEVNVASFHPSAGGGIVYGTKEGRLGILRYDRSVNLT
ncbi:uncharacterized protein LOC124911538 [Impatiens glandulifera]|uniref:uncharacterized protein LOC124911538 n=1 Tax=Impatiens glandulifera TaxID=253017 RepID=UPI001FB1A037|nr:uncharacterized protein LOC124911538 [Impatiens glandulifera]